MKKLILLIIISFLYSEEDLIIDHNCTDITRIPESAINNAKQQLHIGYGHTSHGSQITSGMTGLIEFANNGGKGLDLPEDIFQWNNGGTAGALDLHDGAMSKDVGYYPNWVNETRAYLDDPSNSDVNVIMWSWCGQVDSKYRSGHLWDEYLEPMNQLEEDYPGVKFVYMTGHVDINDDTDNKAANDSIRSFCQNNSKILYDFADIERWDPDDNYYAYVHDNCDYYDSDYEKLGNWATEWQNSHTEGVDWYNCSSAHSQPLNANQKAYAAWWLFTRLAGWKPVPDTLNISVDSTACIFNDTISVPINFKFPDGFSCNSAEITLGGYQTGLDFIGIDTDSGMVMARGWTYSSNETDDQLLTAYAGSENISGEGQFCNLKFRAIGTPCSFVPITIESAIFNNGQDSVEITNGAVYIEPIVHYGDVDDNGEIRAYDAALILKYLVNSNELNCQALANSDVDNDATISNIDAVRILQYLVHTIDTLPYSENIVASGDMAMDDHQFEPGESIQIPITLKNSSSIYGFEGSVQFDTSSMIFNSIQWSDELSNFIKEVNPQKDQIVFAGAGSTEYVGDHGFANLNLEIKNEVAVDSIEISINQIRWNNNSIRENVASATLFKSTAIDKNKTLANEIRLVQNYPNPFNSQTVINYHLPQKSHVYLTIFNISGKTMEILVNENQPPDAYSILWNADHYSSGVYFYRIESGNFTQTKKMLLIK